VGKGASARTLRIAFPSGHLPRAGRDYALSTFDKVSVGYFEGAAPTEAASGKLWEADQGTLTVTFSSATKMKIHLAAARMQSESPDAKGLFDMTGDLTVNVPAR
jgi:hypothetical protein